MSLEGRRSADARRAKAKPWRRWYSTKRWRLRKERQLRLVPWCEPCKALGHSVPATIPNHKIPHRGDPRLFWYGELESCCKPCHDKMVQAAEARGFRCDVDDEGWPSDPAHPFNRLEERRR